MTTIGVTPTMEKTFFADFNPAAPLTQLPSPGIDLHYASEFAAVSPRARVFVREMFLRGASEPDGRRKSGPQRVNLRAHQASASEFRKGRTKPPKHYRVASDEAVILLPNNPVKETLAREARQDTFAAIVPIGGRSLRVRSITEWFLFTMGAWFLYRLDFTDAKTVLLRHLLVRPYGTGGPHLYSPSQYLPRFGTHVGGMEMEYVREVQYARNSPETFLRSACPDLATYVEDAAKQLRTALYAGRAVHSEYPPHLPDPRKLLAGAEHMAQFDLFSALSNWIDFGAASEERARARLVCEDVWDA